MVCNVRVIGSLCVPSSIYEWCFDVDLSSKFVGCARKLIEDDVIIFENLVDVGIMWHAKFAVLGDDLIYNTCFHDSDKLVSHAEATWRLFVH